MLLEPQVVFTLRNRTLQVAATPCSLFYLHNKIDSTEIKIASPQMSTLNTRLLQQLKAQYLIEGTMLSIYVHVYITLVYIAEFNMSPLPLVCSNCFLIYVAR